MLDESRAEANSGRCLSDATLLVADNENRQSGSRVTRETVSEIGVNLGADGEWFVLSILAEVSRADYLSTASANPVERLGLRPF